jgi:hypothetical protein
MPKAVVATVVCVLFSAALSGQAPATGTSPSPAIKLPVAGPVEIFPLDQLRPGMKATAFTAFEGNVPEPFPVEIIGPVKNLWGPGQDIIMAKVFGRAAITGVAGGMSGSPVYIDGKLLGAISLRFGPFLNEAIAGITPIGLMLEINEKDGTRPAMMQATATVKLPLSPEMQAMLDPSRAGSGGSYMTPIETPMAFSGFNEGVMQQFSQTFRELGLNPVVGGASSSLATTAANMAADMSKDPAKLAASLAPGAPVSMVLLDGDVSIASGCTVTYNDLKHVLICGHPFLDFGKVELPMATADVVTTLGSNFQPTKVLNAEKEVGAFVQDRHSGMLGMLGQKAHMIPMEATIHSGNKSKTYHYQVFQNSKFTSFVLVLAAYNTIMGINEFGEDTTYRTHATFKVDGYPDVNLDQLYAAPENAPMPGPLALSFWLGDRFGRIFNNNFEAPDVKGIKLDFDLLPERRSATIEHVWLDKTEAHPGDEVTGRVFLQPYRGEPITKDFKLRIPVNAPKGDLRIQFSDADFVNRYHNFLLMQNRAQSLGQIVNLLNDEKANGQLFITMIQTSPSALVQDKILPSIPSSVASVLDSARATNRLAMTAESVVAQETISLDHVLSGVQTVTVTIK